MSDRSTPADRHGDALVALYESAQARLERVVAAALARGAKGTARYYATQLAIVVDVLSALADRSRPMIPDVAAGAVRATALAVDRILGSTVAFGGVHQDAVDLLSANLAARLDDSIAFVGRRTHDAFRRATITEAAIGLIQGSTSADVADALRVRLIDEGVTDATTGFIDKAGRRWSLESYARMATMTTAREAQSSTVANRITEHGGDLISISYHDTQTKVCKPYEGGTFSLTGKTAGYPVIDRLPPFHPGCWHVAHPATATFDEWERALLAAA